MMIKNLKKLDSVDVERLLKQKVLIVLSPFFFIQMEMDILVDGVYNIKQLKCLVMQLRVKTLVGQSWYQNNW